MQREENLSDQSTSRLFIGIKPDVASQAFLDEITTLCQKQLKGTSTSHIRWTTPNNWHLTLAFLGSIPKEKIPQLKQGLIELAHCKRSFQSRICSLTPFPKQHSKILAVELALNPNLTELHEECRQFIGELGMEPENQEYRPHITLARSRNKEGFRHITPRNLNSSVLVENVILYESVPQTGKSHYHSLLKVPLLND
ncbi:RNA 2',3'-cyclic phosphodiesterase [Microbulbifer sp. PSTR4-B]|uniref:RNA 2',3'-cyclic phosphodiesterase n=1 Tax=Microbulbifer sp. PSTR4-B TaxID=3243396 RepID=UPI00403A1AFE